MIKDSVFTSISELPTPQFTEAAYQLLLLLRHRALLKQITEKDILGPVQGHGIVATDDSLWRKISQSLRALEASEGEPLAELSDARLLKYRKTLDRLLTNKAPRTPASTGVSGQSMLDLLREEPAVRIHAGVRSSAIAHRSKPTSTASAKTGHRSSSAKLKRPRQTTPLAEIA